MVQREAPAGARERFSRIVVCWKFYFSSTIRRDSVNEPDIIR